MAYTKQEVKAGDIMDPAWGNHIQTQYDAAIQELGASKIIEHNTSAAGSYWKWENGLQICTRLASHTFDLDKTTEYSFPSPFVGVVYGTGSILIVTSSSSRMSAFGDAIITAKTTGWVVNSKAYNSEVYDVQLIAIGKWK